MDQNKKIKLLINQVVSFQEERLACVRGERSEAIRGFEKKIKAINQGAKEEAKRHAQRTGVPNDCHKGCTKCCKMFVPCTPIEADVIAHRISSDVPLLREYLRNHIERDILFVDNANLIERLHNKGPTLPDLKEFLSLEISCPFLFGGQCSIYDIRPLGCGSYFCDEIQRGQSINLLASDHKELIFFDKAVIEDFFYCCRDHYPGFPLSHEMSGMIYHLLTSK
jgi:Fe-S-cluster containining protein